MGTNYSEQIFQSIDKIISQRLNEVSFDKTELCTVISEDKNYAGKYLVSNEAGLKYDAYVTNENYKYVKGQKIYVTVPQGNYLLRKLIIGNYFSDEIPKNLYTNPFNHLIVSSEYHWITSENPLSVYAYKNNKVDQKPFISNELTFYYSGLGQFNYIGLNFALTTGFGGTAGEFQIIIDLLDGQKNSLLTTTELGLLTFSSKQLYGNPYYLNDTLTFQHLFNFPVGQFNDLTKVKYIQVTLVAKGDFNYSNKSTQIITLNDLTLYFGFDSSENIMSNSQLVLDLDVPDNTNTAAKDYTYSTDTKQMSIDWVDTKTTAIYNETINRQYPAINKYNIYWLQYSESIGYKKLLETDKPKILSCYPTEGDWSKEEYENALKNKFKNGFNESIDVYDKALYDKYVSLYDTSYTAFANNIENIFIDIEESGTYWKTIKKTDAADYKGYLHSISPAETWKNEQIKVIIKSVEGEEYLTSQTLIFTNTNFRQEVGSNQGQADTLKLTLAEGDDGIYNSYGIDNKLLTTEIDTHKITVSFIDESLEKLWNNKLQKVIWKIPKHASMIAIPQIRQEEADGSFKFVEDVRWDKESDPNFYIYTNSDDDDAKIINFNISTQFGYNKTNNMIICEIVRYKSELLDIIDDIYNGSIKLQFGTQGTSGSAYAFNIYPNTSDGLLKDGSNSIKFAAKLEDNKGQNIPFNANNVQWYFLYGGEEIKHESIPTGDVYIIDKNFIDFIESKGKNSYYCILVAELTSWTDTTGNNINLKAYYPIPRTSMTGYYVSGASRIIYNYQGSSPNYDQSAYTLYDKYHHKIPVARWEIRFPSWKDEKYWSEGKKTGYWNNFPSLKKINENSSELRLQPLPNIQTNVLACNITAYKDDSNETSSILWAQPLLIIRNSYAFDVLNQWDGNLIIDSKGNKILSQLIGAGIKNEDNQFTGVLMGAVGKYGAASTGLYGFQNGNLRYKLDEYGNFYVGTGDNNKIEFSGASDNKILTIEARSFILDTEKLLINSTEGIKLLDGEGNVKIEFLNNGTATIGGWNIGTASLSYNDEELYFGIGNNAVITGKFKEDDTDTTKYSVALKLGNNFGVTKNGTLYAKDAVLRGDIYADDGYFKGNIDIDGGATITGKISATNIKVGDVISTGKGAITTITEDTIKTTTVKAENLIVDAAKIDGKLTADQIEADALKVDTIDVSAIKGTGTTSANITMSGNVTINGALKVTGTGTIGGMTLNASSISASGGSSSTSLSLNSTFNATMAYSSNQVKVSGYGSGWYNRVYYIPCNGTVSMSGSSSDEFYIMNTVPSGNGNYSVSQWKKGSISVTVSAGQYLIHNTSSSTIRTASLSVSTNFSINSNGTLTASNATITGKITATSGNIGGWVIGSYYIRSAIGVYGEYEGISTSGSSIRKTGYLFTVLSNHAEANGLFYVVKASNNFADNTVAAYSAMRGGVTVFSGGTSI